MNFAIFICTHGRPYAQFTYNALRTAGFTGKIYLVVDDEDSTVPALQELGYDILQFCKQYYIDTVDIGRRRSDAKRAAILYAKCACEDFAKELQLDAFVIADDDLTNLRYRYEEDGHLKSLKVSNLDKVVENYCEYMLESGVCMTSFGAMPLYMAGIVTPKKIEEARIPYNILFRNTSIPFNWISEMNEDIISVLADKSGHYIQMLPFIKYDMKELHAGAQGGMTANYKAMTLFQRVQTIIMYDPVSVYYIAMKTGITHAVHKELAFPKLISSSCKKS